MAHDLLGPSFDIHGGGIDLAFPHHENEAAQSRCAHPEGTFANIWMHNGFLQVEGEKMSKSLGNFFTVRDLLDRGVPGEVIRFVLLSTHYRQPMDWTQAKVDQAEATLRDWRRTVAWAEAGEPESGFVEALADDLNTPRAIAELHKLARDPGSLKASAGLLGLLDDALGGWERPRYVDSVGLLTGTSEIVARKVDWWVEQRAAAKAAKDFSRADRIRDVMEEAGIVLKDTPAGTTWEFGLVVDLSKLEALG
jgi:cysteinyl-tRNA synthetase